MVLHGEVDAGVGGMTAQGSPGEADLVFVLGRELLDRDRTHLVPLVVRVHLVADDPTNTFLNFSAVISVDEMSGAIRVNFFLVAMSSLVFSLFFGKFSATSPAGAERILNNFRIGQ